MESIVLELQRETLDSTKNVSDLLRKALVISQKLSLIDFQNWIEKELNGYDENDDVPSYRAIIGEVRGWNPYNGWIPLIFQDPQIGEMASTRKTNQSIAQLESLVNERSKNSELHMPFSQTMQRTLSKNFGYETQVSLIADRASLIKIIDSVRNIILNWALKLEQDGILGEGLAFTKQEKKTAVKSPQNINYFFGPVKNSQILQGNKASQLTMINKYEDVDNLRSFIEILKTNLSKVDIDSTTKLEVDAEIGTLESQCLSPKPKKNIIKECLLSLRKIFEGASGSAVAKILLKLSELLAS